MDECIQIMHVLLSDHIGRLIERLRLLGLCDFINGLQSIPEFLNLSIQLILTTLATAKVILRLSSGLVVHLRHLPVALLQVRFGARLLIFAESTQVPACFLRGLLVFILFFGVRITRLLVKQKIVNVKMAPVRLRLASFLCSRVCRRL